jgi:hypothetical protein
MPMRRALILALPALLSAAPLLAQKIEEVPASKVPTVYRPDDLFRLPPGQWHMSKQLWEGAAPCAEDQCEAGYTSGDLVLSVEHSKTWVRIMAGFRGCAPVAFSEIETGKKPGRHTRGQVSDQIGKVVKGAAKTCKMSAPDVAKLNVAALFPETAAK